MTKGIKNLAVLQACVANTTVLRVKASVVAQISEPFEQPTFCFYKGE